MKIAVVIVVLLTGFFYIYSRRLNAYHAEVNYRAAIANVCAQVDSNCLLVFSTKQKEILPLVSNRTNCVMIVEIPGGFWQSRLFRTAGFYTEHHNKIVASFAAYSYLEHAREKGLAILDALAVVDKDLYVGAFDGKAMKITALVEVLRTADEQTAERLLRSEANRWRWILDGCACAGKNGVTHEK